jgi:hypothetical protein
MWRSTIWWRETGWQVLKILIAALLAAKVAKFAINHGVPSFRVTGYAIDLTRIAIFLLAFNLAERAIAFAWKPVETPAEKAKG